MQVRNHIIPDDKYRIKNLIEKFDNNMLNLSTKVSLMVLGHRYERSGKFLNAILQTLENQIGKCYEELRPI